MKVLPGKPGIFIKLLMGYVILLLIMALPYFISIVSLDRLSGYAAVVADSSIEIFRDVTELRNIAPDLGISAREWMNFGDRRALKSLLEKNSHFNKVLRHLRGKVNVKITGWNPEGCITLIDRISQLTVELQNYAVIQFEREIHKVHPDFRRMQTSITEHFVTGVMDRLVNDLRELESRVQHLQSSYISYISEKSARTRHVTGLLLVCAAAFTLLAPLFLYRYLKRPIDMLTMGTEIIGRGEFDKPIPVMGNDELSDLARSFNVMASRLKELDALKSDFIAVAGHELRTPLAAISEAAKLLQEPMVGTLNERQERLVKVLNSSMKRLRGFIDQILELSRLKAGLEAIETKPGDLVKLVREVAETLQPLAWEKDVKIRVLVKQGAFTARMDDERLFRAVMNLVDNAVKFSPRGQVVKIHMDMDKKRSCWLRIGIADAGPGISQEEEGKIFDKFYQIQSVRKKGGAGLGLAIAREIISAHGGKVWVESPPPSEYAVKEGSGALFWFTLPC